MYRESADKGVGGEGGFEYPCPETLPAMPAYMSGHYRWAYLWKPGVWFFDHMPIINCIVFGQYRRMVTTTLEHYAACDPAGSTLLVASAYGDLVPRLAQAAGDRALTVIDVAPIQVRRARAKLDASGLGDRVEVRLMDAEHLTFPASSFDTLLMFLLLNELPPAARRRALVRAAAVLRPGGQLVVTEYGALGTTHGLHRFAPMRWLVTRAEPYLDSLWRADLASLIDECAREVGKSARLVDETPLFGGFYRVMRFEFCALDR